MCEQPTGTTPIPAITKPMIRVRIVPTLACELGGVMPGLRRNVKKKERKIWNHG
ncbi:MAG: hypothetical protein LC104_04810 [Bacteroidales bacterium]|nr:hypothetical protein [Bacteroidales bacterium]